jgi:hypothetical protein
MGLISAPALQPRPRLADSPRFIELEENLRADSEQAAVRSESSE